MSDLISRQAAIEALCSECQGQCIPCESYPCSEVDVINALPSAQPERKKGKWLADNRRGGGFWVCSCCKFPSEAFAANVLYNFCPNCGADMRGEQDGKST